MRIIKNITYTIVFLLLGQGVIAQSYIEKTDASGFNTSPYLTELGEAADSLVAAFPDTFQNNFKVFSFGFYVPTESFDGFGYPEAFERMKAEVAQESPYYLLIGRQSDQTGIYTKFWVDVKLPETGAFECIKESTRNVLYSTISGIMNSEFEKLGGVTNFFATAEKIGMDTLINFVKKQVDCCNPGAKTTACSDCPTDKAIYDFLLANGFYPIDVDSFSLSISTKIGSKTTNVDDFANVSLYLNGSNTLWDLNAAISGDLTGAEAEGYSVKGIIMDNYNFCITDFYQKVKDKYYKSNFDVSVLAHFWTKENEQNEVVDSKLFLKTNIVETPLTEIELLPLENWNPDCSFDPLPQIAEENQYVIAINPNDGKAYGYHGNSDGNWDIGDVVEKENIPDPADDFPSPKETTYDDCEDYPVEEYGTNSHYWRSRWEKEGTWQSNWQSFWTNTVNLSTQPFVKEMVLYFAKGEIKNEPSGRLDFSCGHGISKYARKTTQLNDYIGSAEDILKNWFREHKSFDGLMAVKGYEFVNKPSSNPAGFVPNSIKQQGIEFDAYIVLGGLQGWGFKIKSIKKLGKAQGGYYPKDVYECEFIATIHDLFGAGYGNDRDRLLPFGLHKYLNTPFPGLASMWLLQHCGNASCIAGGKPPCFLPYYFSIPVWHKFTFTVKR